VLVLSAVALILERLGLRSPDWRDELVGRELAAAFTKLEGLYIKFGQLLAMRPDLISPVLLAPLESLFDKVPPEPFERTASTIRDELGSNPSEIFASFDPNPIAAGSLATVYRATLKTGESVAVKVQRKDIVRIVRLDLRWLFFFSGLLDASGVLKRFRLSQFIAEFSHWTTEELNYERESRNMEFLRDKQLKSSKITIPVVFWSYCTPKVLTMEFFDGVWLTDRNAMDGMPDDDRTSYARSLFASFMHDIFELGFFHADPHPGNLCILEDGRIGLIDFGIVGYVSEEAGRAQAELLWAIQRNDISAAFQAVLRVLNIPPDAKLDQFRNSFEENIRDWNILQYQPTLPARARSGSRLLLANFQAARQCGLSFKASAARYYRTFILMDTIVTRIDGNFDHQAALGVYFRRRYIRSRVKRGLLLLSGPELQMQNLARLERFITGLERLVLTSADSVISSTLDQGMLRLSRIFRGLSCLSAVFLVFFVALFVMKSASPNTLDTLLGSAAPAFSEINRSAGFGVISIALLISAILLRWLGRITWINAYKGEQFTPNRHTARN
jgi:ubiquinone biosynthesis protein